MKALGALPSAWQTIGECSDTGETMVCQPTRVPLMACPPVGKADSTLGVGQTQEGLQLTIAPNTDEQGCNDGPAGPRTGWGDVAES